MPFFIKTEKFTAQAKEMSPSKRQRIILEHKQWAEELIASGKRITSGYLTNEYKQPGGGGFLVIETSCFNEAKSIIEKDPMITNNLVLWDLNEWIPVVGTLL
tara:strand:+ start:588 stop:893 length:306 start_codon:yes stop_codon:yes gene_type:complete